MNIEELNSLYSHAGYITFKEGPSGFPIALITTPHATAAITTYGAQLLSYTFASDPHDLLFLGDKAIFSEGTPIRGGIPICWPWFGPDPQNQGRSDHGLARTRIWKVGSTYLLGEGECVITFELTDTPETYPLWPHHFRLILKLTVGKKLILELTTRNLGDTPMVLSQAFHTYFALEDIARTTVTGLEGCIYRDQTEGRAEKTQSGEIRIDSETDRIYHSGGNDIILNDELRQRKITIASEGSKTAVVWNPWSRVCNLKPDLDTDDYKKMLCIETANAGEDLITLEPEQKYTLKATYSIE